MTTVCIEPLTTQDLKSPDCAEIYLQAFATDAFSLAAFPRTDPTSLSAWWTNMFLDEHQSQRAARFLKASINGHMVAFAKWNIPTRTGVADDSDRGGSRDNDNELKLEHGGDDPDSLSQAVYPPHANQRLAGDFLQTLAKRRCLIMGDRPHCYLELVATLPEYQGRGAASGLLRWGLDVADQMGIEAYLESNEENVLFYERFGFAFVEGYVLEEIDYRESFMLRPARKSKLSV